MSHIFLINTRLLNQRFIKSYSVLQCKKGDNLYSISRKFNIPIQKIIKSNKIKSPFKIFPNQKIFLPSNKVYSVIKGDTLYSISRKFKTDLYSLSVLNKLDNINQIKVNQKILIPDVVLNVKKTKKSKKSLKKGL